MFLKVTQLIGWEGGQDELKSLVKHRYLARNKQQPTKLANYFIKIARQTYWLQKICVHRLEIKLMGIVHGYCLFKPQ